MLKNMPYCHSYYLKSIVIKDTEVEISSDLSFLDWQVQFTWYSLIIYLTDSDR